MLAHEITSSQRKGLRGLTNGVEGLAAHTHTSADTHTHILALLPL